MISHRRRATSDVGNTHTLGRAHVGRSHPCAAVSRNSNLPVSLAATTVSLSCKLSRAALSGQHRFHFVDG